MDITTTDVSSITTTSAMSGGTITGIGGDYVPITDRILRNKFQLFNRNREKLSGNVKVISPIPLLQLYEESKQMDESGEAKQFVLVASRFRPISGIQTVELFEYDNSTDVTLEDV